MSVVLSGSVWYRRTTFWAANQPLTACIWFYSTTNPTSGNYTNIINQEGAQGLALYNTGGVKLNVGTNANDFPGTTTIAANTWYHAAWTRSGNNHLGYVNGVQECSGTDSQSVGTTLNLGAWTNVDNGIEFIGRLAAAKIWNVALSAIQIQQEMRQYAPVITSGLIGFFPLIDVNTDQDDFSGNGATLTVTGTPTTEQGPPIPWNAGRRRLVYIAGGAGAQNITGSTIASGNSLAAPTVAPGAVTVAGGTIASGSTLSAPTSAYQVLAAALSSAASLFAATVTVGAVTIAGANIASGAQSFAPVVAPGSVEIAGATIASGAQSFAPTAAHVVDGATIASGATTNVPTLTYEVTGAAISAGTLLHAPSVGSGATEVTGETVASTLILSAPTVSVGAVTVDGATIASGSTLAAATVTPGAVTVSGATIASGHSLSAPVVSTGGTSVVAQFISSTTSLAAPVVAPGAVTVLGATISSGETLLEPTVSQGAIVPPNIPSTTTLSAPTLAYALTTASVSSGSSLSAPAVYPDQAVAGSTIASGSSLTAPTAAYAVSAASLSSTASLTGPSLATGSVTLTTAYLSSGTVMHPPLVGHIIDGTPVVRTVKAKRRGRTIEAKLRGRRYNA